MRIGLWAALMGAVVCGCEGAGDTGPDETDTDSDTDTDTDADTTAIRAP